MRVRALLVGLLMVTLLAGGQAQSAGKQSAAERVEGESATVVREFLKVFNKQDIAKMSALVASDVLWLSMTKNGTFKADLQGWPALAKWLKNYFAATKNVRSEASQLNANGPFVSFTETASWQSPTGVTKKASSLAVYEVQGGKISRIWYYPAVSAVSATP